MFSPIYLILYPFSSVTCTELPMSCKALQVTTTLQMVLSNSICADEASHCKYDLTLNKRAQPEMQPS